MKLQSQKIDLDTVNRDTRQKKLRERTLIEQFIALCPDYSSYKFSHYEENPDMVYTNQAKQEVGFDSIIISEDQAAASCYFEPDMCQIGIPTKLKPEEKTEKIMIFFENKLFSHLRRYRVPTVLVFSLINTQSTSLQDLAGVMTRFKLPEFSMYNITDYYLCDGRSYIKINESKI